MQLIWTWINDKQMTGYLSNLPQDGTVMGVGCWATNAMTKILQSSTLSLFVFGFLYLIST